MFTHFAARLSLRHVIFVLATLPSIGIAQILDVRYGVTRDVCELKGNTTIRWSCATRVTALSGDSLLCLLRC